MERLTTSISFGTAAVLGASGIGTGIVGGVKEGVTIVGPVAGGVVTTLVAGSGNVGPPGTPLPPPGGSGGGGGGGVAVMSELPLGDVGMVELSAAPPDCGGVSSNKPARMRDSLMALQLPPA